MATTEQHKKPFALAITLIITGAIGLLSSFQLMLDKLKYLEDPNADLSCNWGLTVQCGANLNSWQGAVFGFPNPIVGLMAFVVPLVIGAALLGGARFSKWFWWGFLAGVALGFTWVVWFVYQSIFNVGTLCPWCMTMWSAMIPMFWTTLFYSMKSGKLGEGLKRSKIVKELWSWTWVIVIFSYIAIAIIAQLRLDVINNF